MDNLAFCFIYYLVSCSAYSNCKCEDSAVMEINHSCKSDDAHSIHKTTKHTRNVQRIVFLSSVIEVLFAVMCSYESL